ncbi:MAG: lipase family alpha/beta hydrolase [Planctomycetota bacterium]|jgi:triacylglycerol esterase/lipase EstA (alpha/beta hydrolase family)
MEEQREPETKRKLWRRLPPPLGIAMLLYFLPVFMGCMNLSTPVDYVINIGSFAHRPELLVPADGKRHVVFLKHGIFRSAGSLWKLERALRDHGYEVVNISYPSTDGYIEDFSTTMAAEVADYLRDSPREVVKVHFIGHSMGGLVIRHYLTRKDAITPDSCVFIAVPHRGAVLTDARKDRFLFRTFLGNKAALQLSPDSEFYNQLQAPHDGFDYGCIYGTKGEPEGWNDDIPGDDDGTVGADEAQLPGATDSHRLRLGHTRISFDDQTIEQVLHFLKHGTFRN